APQARQAAAQHRVLDPVGAVQVPGIRRAARTAARLVVGHAGPRARVVGLLGFPGDDAALDVDLPRTGARAVHPVGRAHDLVVLPAVAVSLLPPAVFLDRAAVAIGERFADAAEIFEAIDEIAHGRLLEASSGATTRSCALEEAWEACAG